MSQRGRGSGPQDDDPASDDAGQERASDAFTFPESSRPIAPYDPYRSASGDASSRMRRNVAADDVDATVRRPSRSSSGPFLPDDDPLNAEAWQLDLDDAEIVEDFDAPLPPLDREPAPRRRERRQPPVMRVGRGADAERRAPRRERASASGARARVPRGAVTIGIPRAVAGSSLIADPTALALLAVNAASVVLMALLLAARLGGLPNPTILHLDAAGNPDRWGPPGVLWRLPVMAFFTTVMFLVVAWFLHPLDRFAARFALGAAIVAQVVAWVAVIQHLFMA